MVMVDTCSVLLHMVGYLQQSIGENEDFKEPVQSDKMGDFQKRRQSWCTSQMAGNLVDQIRKNKNLKGAIRNVKKQRKRANWAK